jgi:hypothetical protein
MASIPELLKGHVTLEVECLDRLYLNGYIGRMATPAGLVMFKRGLAWQADPLTRRARPADRKIP